MILSILSIIFSSSILAHDLHLSETIIDISDSQVNIQTKIFYDDLLNAVGLEVGQEKEEGMNSDSLINDFVKENLRIEIDKNNVEWKYNSSILASQAVWTDFTIDFDSIGLSEINIDNFILLDLFDDQKNIVIIKNNDKEERFMLDKSKKSIHYSLN